MKHDEECNATELYYAQKEDIINHPAHYNFGNIEPIDVIEDWDLTYHEGNIIKYIARGMHKGDYLENLKKAQYYLNRAVQNEEVRRSIYDMGN